MAGITGQRRLRGGEAVRGKQEDPAGGEGRGGEQAESDTFLIS